MLKSVGKMEDARNGKKNVDEQRLREREAVVER